MTWPSDIQSNTPADYLFKLVSQTQEVICNPDPLEWASGTLEMRRDLKAGGVFSTFQQESLTFVGEAAAMLRSLFDAFEVNAKCTLIVYWWKNSTRTYIEFPSRFDINFNFYEIVKVGKFHFGVKIKAINSSVQTKLDSRMDIDININNTVSIGGESITMPPISKRLIYPAIDINYTGELESADGAEYDLPHIAGVPTYTSVPTVLKNSDFIAGKLQTVPYLAKTALHNIEPFYKNEQVAHNLSIYYYIEFKVTNNYAPSAPWEFKFIQTTSAGVDTVIASDEFGQEERFYIYNETEAVTLAVGDSLRFVVYADGINATYIGHCSHCYIEVTEAVQSAPISFTEGVPVYDALERLAANILDTRYPIYSEYFGRTAMAYNEGVYYATENQLRFAHIQSGLNQRGLPIDDPDSPLSLNFIKLFDSLNAIYNIGYSLETISGAVRIRIEEYSHFFEDYEALDLSARLNKYDIQSSVMPELIPVEFKCGFESFEYLTVNGRSEPNTSNQRTSIMNTATKWTNISPYRADTKGIYDNLANPISTDTGSSDTKGDDSIYIVKTQKIGVIWFPETDTNIEIKDNSSVFKDAQLNRLFTPSRMLKRHGNRLRAGLLKFPASYLTFQKSDKSSTLDTEGEGYRIKENDNILVSTLAQPLYKAIKHNVSVKFTFADLQLLTAHPYGYITLSDTISGYLLTLKKKNGKDEADITLIERNIILS